MVIRVIVEGGVLPSPNDDSLVTDQTLVRSEVLRENLKRFFSTIIGSNDISIIVSNAAGNKNAAKFFAASSEEHYLYTDLDDKPHNRDEWFKKMTDEGIIIPNEKIPNVYFWISEMEVWFLKQPQCIESWANDHRVDVIKPVAEDSLIKDKNVECIIQKPSDVMTIIFRRDLKDRVKDKNGKNRKLIFNKLRHSPDLLDYLDPFLMLEQDSELTCFVESVKRRFNENKI